MSCDLERRHLIAHCDYLQQRLAELQPNHSRGDRLRTVRNHVRERAMRREVIIASLISDPVWDIIIALYAAMLEGVRMSISAAVAAADAPPTTGLRALDMLVSRGFAEREADPTDARRVIVTLSARAFVSVTSYFDQVTGTLLDWSPEEFGLGRDPSATPGR